MPTSQEMKVQNTFDKAMDQINNLQKVFRDEGMLAKTVVDIGGSQDFGAIQEAFDNLYGALEDAHYDAMAHIEVESVKQKLGMNEDPSRPKFPIEVELAGDSIWDRDEPNPKTVTITDYKFDKDEEGYESLYVMHDGPWTIYTDSGFEKEISDIIAMEVSFSEQGMQDDGVAHLEGSVEMESVKEDTITEGYESKVREICKDAGVDCSFKDGKLYVAKEDMAKAKKALEDNEDILELPEMVAENSELDRLKHLIGVDTIREMKQ